MGGADGEVKQEVMSEGQTEQKEAEALTEEEKKADGEAGETSEAMEGELPADMVGPTGTRTQQY